MLERMAIALAYRPVGSKAKMYDASLAIIHKRKPLIELLEIQCLIVVVSGCKATSIGIAQIGLIKCANIGHRNALWFNYE